MFTILCGAHVLAPRKPLQKSHNNKILWYVPEATQSVSCIVNHVTCKPYILDRCHPPSQITLPISLYICTFGSAEHACVLKVERHPWAILPQWAGSRYQASLAAMELLFVTRSLRLSRNAQVLFSPPLSLLLPLLPGLQYVIYGSLGRQTYIWTQSQLFL